MLFKPYGIDNWWRITRRIHPDRLVNLWEHSWGEFSVRATIAFDKHLEKLRIEKSYATVSS